MARGLDQVQGRRNAAAALGKNLSRRARNRCELCGESAPLQVVEVPPIFEEPDVDRAVIVCARCEAVIVDRRGQDGPEKLRFLNTSVWSDVAPVQLTAVRILRRLGDAGVLWARELLEGVYLDPELEALL